MSPRRPESKIKMVSTRFDLASDLIGKKYVSGARTLSAILIKARYRFASGFKKVCARRSLSNLGSFIKSARIRYQINSASTIRQLTESRLFHPIYRDHRFVHRQSNFVGRSQPELPHGMIVKLGGSHSNFAMSEVLENSKPASRSEFFNQLRFCFKRL